MNLLSHIVSGKHDEVRRARARLPPAELRARLPDAPPLRDFAAALASREGAAIIAEVKRASPSLGVLRPDRPWDPEGLARAYERGGARALSVLTDTPSFWGSADTLVACRAACALPVLRKEFIVDAYQVDESRWLGADAVLLMASVLDDDALTRCAARAFELGMCALLEVHAERELERVLQVAGPPERTLVGINHRDLTTLNVDLTRSAELVPRVPKGRALVAESGIESSATLRRLLDLGIERFLVGGHLCTSDDPEAALRALLEGV